MLKLKILTLLITQIFASKLQQRIAGGNIAAVGQFPYVGSLQTNGVDESHFCGCTLINIRFLLTSAMCVQDRNADTIQAILGTNQLDSGGIVHRIDRIIIHPEYNFSMILNDIALLRTAQQVLLSPLVQLVQLTTLSTGENVNGRIMGWGATRENGSSMNLMRFFNTRTLLNSQCITQFIWAGRPEIRDKIHSSVMCTYSRADQGGCNKDQGGPLLNGRIIIGIQSFAFCGTGVPDVFTRYATYHNWVNETMRENL